MSQVFAEIEKNRIYITSEVRDRELCKSLTGRRWDNKAQKWHTSISWSSCKQLRAVFGERLEIGPNLLEWAQNELTQRVQPALALRYAILLPSDHPIRVRLEELGLA